MKREVQKRLSGLLLVLFSLIISAGAVATDESYRVVIVPFKINAEIDLSFLQEGIVDMLTSRLSWENTAVVDRKDTNHALQDLAVPLNEKTARVIGARLQADYVLFGSVTIFGNSVSLDARLVDVHEKKPTLTYYNQSEKIDDVIPQVNLFATEINEKFFGRSVAVRQPVKEPEEHRAIYAHPETLLAGESSGQAQAPGEEAARTAGPGFEEIRDEAGPMASAGYWKSQNFKIRIKGIAIGDLDGDDKKEVVFITDRDLYVYRFEGQRFLKIKEISGKRHQRFIGVDVADINENGLAEIFVTSLSGSGQSLDSFVLESNGDDFRPVSEGDPWYYRVIEMPDLGKVLVGQRRTMKDPFVGGVHRLAWLNGRYEPQERIRLPKGVNVFGFAIGDIMGKAGETIIAFDEDDHIRLFGSSGGEEWKSDEPYGGGMNYLDINPDVGRGGTVEHLYLPQRIYARDVNGDGKEEVIVASNEGSLGRLFATYRTFSSGRIVCLSFKDHGLVKILQIPKISGYISDYAIGDIDSDGIDEVVVASVHSKGTLVTAGTSSIMAYELAKPGSAR
ncbi:MAG: VCBS repeat-containing protein [Deltaproteobacteria bacterium]|nr:VCBS repeat-containing protein [Deltaproteobacteria bacterium]